MKTKLLFALFACVLIAILSSCDIFGANVKRYAYVYGIANYLSVTPSLTYTVPDAISIRDLLEKNGYTVVLRTDAAATKAQLLSDLANVPSDAASVLFYFSGHGAYNSTDPLITYICPYDTAGISSYSTMISSDELSYAMSQIKCQQKITIMDSCFSGGFVDTENAFDYSPSDYTGAAIALPRLMTLMASLDELFAAKYHSRDTTLYISAAGSSEVSNEYAYLSHGAFTYFFLQSQSKGDANLDGIITASEAVSYSYTMLANYWTEWLKDAGLTGAGDFHLPHISAEAYDFALFKASR